MARMILSGLGAEHAPMQVPTQAADAPSSSAAGSLNNLAPSGASGGNASGISNFFGNFIGGILGKGASDAGATFQTTVNSLLAADAARQQTSSYVKLALAGGVVVVGGILAWGLTRK